VKEHAVFQSAWDYIACLVYCIVALSPVFLVMYFAPNGAHF
jgi:hypothetical protein